MRLSPARRVSSFISSAGRSRVETRAQPINIAERPFVESHLLSTGSPSNLASAQTPQSPALACAR
jgi:hypothetical protein